MAKDTDTGGTDLAAGTNGTEAAEISHQHGYHLGELIFRKSPGIRKIHFIAHSAGAWAARAAARYLSQASTNPPEIQITLLDPFIPAELTDGKDTALSKGVMDNLFDSNEGVKSLVIADNYTLIETGWDWVPGTNELFNWPEDVSFASGPRDLRRRNPIHARSSSSQPQPTSPNTPRESYCLQYKERQTNLLPRSSSQLCKSLRPHP